MKKHKVVNNMFFRAGHSFSELSMYYRHVVTQLRYYADDLKKSGKEIAKAEKEKGREFDRQRRGKYESIFAEIWPGYFHNSFLTSACSQFEHEIKQLCAIIQEEHRIPFAWDDLKGTKPEKTRGYLKHAGVALQDDAPRIEFRPPDFKPTEVYEENRTVISELWNELEYYYRVRNCIIHDNGLVGKARGADTLQAYAAERGILIERNGRPEIQLNQDFNLAVCDTMRRFFEKLMSAYYSAPLPE